MAKKLDAQTQSFDAKINELADSMNTKMTTNQQATQQMLREMADLFTAHLTTLMANMQKCNNITEKHNSQINSIKAHMPLAGDGPNSKQQRHGDE
eukprot:6185488-Ditylum_brightwellii.AAC.1